jgi:hypothetical protein
MAGIVQKFSPEVCEQLGSYVYRLIDPRTGQTFYVGKGSGNRAFDHADHALAGAEGLRYGRILAIKNAGLEPIVLIHRYGLGSEVAYEVEAALIDAYAELTQEVGGHGTERGLRTPAKIIAELGAPEAQIAVPAILIKIQRQWHDQLTPDQLYERTRRYWNCNPERNPIPPRYALSIAHGLIREVYEIERWEDYKMDEVSLDPTRLTQSSPERAKGTSALRKGFVGRVTGDEALREALIGKSVRHVPFGSGNPIAYVNCDMVGSGSK